MAFRIRDLMITVLPQGWERIASEPCDGGSDIPPGPPPDPGPDPEERFFLKEIETLEARALLQLALTRLGGPPSAQEMLPRAVPDLDALEERLTAALAEVKALRAQFAKDKGAT